MQVAVNKKIEVLIMLDEDEAKMLRDAMQNQFDENEPEDFTKFRQALFTAINSELPNCEYV